MIKTGWVLVGVAVAVLVSCSTLPPATACSADADCGAGLACVEGKCVAAAAQCTSGETRPCGPDPVGACRRGTQSCVDGAFEAACAGAVNPTAELCNGVDDDCDGTVDEGVTLTFYVDRDGDGFGSNSSGAETAQACTKPTGFSANNTDCNDTPGVGFFTNPGATEACDPGLSDENCNGMANEGCGCNSVGATQPCCAGRGSQVCEARDGGLTLSACSVLASVELCNGVDDDCNGQIDETFAVDGGALPGDGGVSDLDGGCTVGAGTCARSGRTSCVSATLVCSATAGAPGTESCNGLDDDCDGEVDEAPATLCAITGQVCAAATCACPSGQSVCGSSCQAVGASCSNGVGACARSGVMACTAGTVSCDAVAGTPATEVCNDVDDNCDGTIDEPSASLCSVTGQLCNAGTCACPSGQAACGTSCQAVGATCSNGVGACARPGVIACAGSTTACNAVAGSPVGETCDGVDNDCDGAIDNGVTITCYPDADNDQYASSTTASQLCPAAGRAAFGNCPVGFVAPAASLGIDCDPANSSAFRLVASRADADNDTHCAGVSALQCVGATAPTGRRFSAACAATDDCNDANANAFNTYTVRTDSDGDGYCVGASVTQCAGNAPLAGTRLASTCQAVDDCRDLNFNATTTCFIPVGYTTVFHTMSCGIGLPNPTDTFVTTTTFCPIGFSLLSVRTEKSAGAGTCTANDANNLHQSCSGFDSSTCRIVADCTAN